MMLNATKNSELQLAVVIKNTTATTTTTTTILQLSGLRPGQPGWAGTSRKIHPLTPIMVINHPLSASSIFTVHGILVQFTCL